MALNIYLALLTTYFYLYGPCYRERSSAEAPPSTATVAPPCRSPQTLTDFLTISAGQLSVNRLKPGRVVSKRPIGRLNQELGWR